MNKYIKVLAVAALLCGVSYIGSQSNYKEVAGVFEIDTVTAATDGTECNDPAWTECAPGWIAKGYVFDDAKGYYVKGSGGGATTTPKVTTTTPKATTTTKKAEVTTPKVTTTTKKGDTTAKTETTTAPVTTADTSASDTTAAPEVTTTEVTTTEVTTTVTTAAPKSDEGLPIPLIAGGIAVVAIAGFFIFSAMKKK